MGIWNNGGFFSKVTGHVVKWWQLVFLPVFNLNNNGKPGENQDIMHPKEQALTVEDKKNIDKSVADRDVEERTRRVLEEKQDRINKAIEEGKEHRAEEKIKAKSGMDSKEAMEILERIEQEKLEVEKQKQKQIETVRKQAQEQARIASIMSANKVDVNAFIEAGKASRLDSDDSSKKISEDEKKRQEDIKRAQEIIERLNKEAAEDEAKKAAEIEEAKRQAMGR